MKLWGRKEEPVDPEAVKARSMTEVVRLGGRTIDWLPIIDQTEPRTGEELTARTLVLNAMIGLAYEAPVSMIREWIVANGLTQSLTPSEAEMLRQETGTQDPQALVDLSWSMEALAGLLWAGGFAKELPIDGELTMDVLGALPRVGQGESGRDFSRRVRMRSYAELYAMRDLYYRAHWFARDGRINGYSTEPFIESVILERRRALEWLLDKTADWNDMDLST